MTYYMLNIKHPTDPEAATSWLDKEKQAPVFFGESSIAELKTKLGGGALFGRVGQDEKLREAARIVTISEGFVWLYAFAGKIRRLKRRRSKPNEKVADVPKVIPIRLFKKRRLQKVPLILASMTANQHFTRGTFAKIDDEKYPGNVAALDVLWRRTPRRISRLQCLSSIELETLVAKILEANGAFVPAYKGGFLKGIDLFAYTRTAGLCGLPLAQSRSGDKVATVQVKLRVTDAKELSRWLEDEWGRCVITVEDHPCDELADLHGQVYFTRDWIESALKTAPAVMRWLNRSTWWYPK